MRNSLRSMPYLNGPLQLIELECGEILKIDQNGNISRHEFEDQSQFWDYWDIYPFGKFHNKESWYLRDLKMIAVSEGISPEIVDRLHSCGMSLWEIEEYIYTCKMQS